MSGIIVLEDKCNGCKKCLKACDQDAIELLNKVAKIDLEKCNLCGLCVNSCKFEAITISKTLKQENLKDHKGIWVFLEYSNNEVNAACLQVLSKAFELSLALKEKVTAVLVAKEFGDKNKIKKLLSEYGVSNIRLLACKELDHSHIEDISTLLSVEIRIGKPSIFLFLGTNFGRETAPRVSADINTGLTADCTELQIDSDGNLVQIRPTYGGKILASIICANNRPQMASVRPNIFESRKINRAKVNTDLNYKEVHIKNSFEGIKRIIETVKATDELNPIDGADIIICGGLGIGSKENFKLLVDLAEKIDGAVAGTREVVDRGWIDFSHQVGQTGKIVRPWIYIGCGVSGAIQHLTGMKNSKKIIAINKDKKAPILKIADIAVIGDLFEVVPLIIDNI